MKNKLLVTILLMVVLSSLLVVKTFATETGGEAGTGGAGTTEEWTDFSKAKYEIKVENGRDIELNITNVTLKEGSSYSYTITNSNSQVPELADITETIFNLNGGKNIDKYYELSGDMYLWIKEYDSSKLNGNKEKMVVNGQKLERIDYNPHYYDAFHDSYFSNGGFYFGLNYSCSSQQIRNANVKIGKITSQALLRKLKNNESGAWKELLQYAKTAEAIVNKKLQTDGLGFVFRASDDIGVNSSNVEDGAYYYVYVDVNSENGKYYPVGPAVTLAQGQSSLTLGEGHFSMYFFRDKQF